MIKTPLSTVIGGAFWTPGATVINGAKLSFETVMKKLFANGEQGFYQDPYDLSTMFQDAVGATAVNASGQPLGLLLDKSGRSNHASQTVSASRPILQQTPILGVNVLPNLDFTKGNTGGVGTTTTTNSFNVTDTAGGVRLDSVFEVGKTYRFKAKAATTASQLLFVNASNGTSPLIANASSGAVDTVFTATNTTLYLRTGTGITTVSELEIKEITGYRTDQNYLKFDAVDDKLITNLPSQLTGCTVIRSVPGVGVQLLTNQTIPATYEDNKDHCGLIVINRALTPSETSAIAAEFNKRAGV